MLFLKEEYMDQVSLTAIEILAIKNPYDLFKSNKEETWHNIIRSLQSKWHPDRNTDQLSGKVMTHINYLYERIQKGDLGQILIINEVSSPNRQWSFKYKSEIDIDIGKMYIGQKMVLFCIDEANRDLYEKAIQSIRSIRFPSKMMEAGFTRLVPKELKSYGLTDKGYVFTVYKGSDQINLGSILKSGICIKPEHLTWIIDRLYQFVLLMHKIQNKIFGSLDEWSIFINPKFRTIHILGGWWCAEHIGSKLVVLPNSIAAIVPDSVLNIGNAETIIDQLSIKNLGIRLLGDLTGVGSKLLTLDKKYQPMVSFLRSNPNSSSLKDFSEWSYAVNDVSRCDLKITFNDIYE